MIAPLCLWQGNYHLHFPPLGRKICRTGLLISIRQSEYQLVCMLISHYACRCVEGSPKFVCRRLHNARMYPLPCCAPLS